jgi:selenocysteine lyase/cysteine desulfurase
MSELEYEMQKRIMALMNLSEDDYTMVFTANQLSAFKLVADSYPFQSNQNLLTVYDYENEAVKVMIESSKNKGARVMSAEFSWPSLRLKSGKLLKKVRRKRKNKRGLFVFPLQSRMTGARYSYLWMTMAQENGWHVLLDACGIQRYEYLAPVILD